MSRQPRQKSSTGLYHVTARGNAHQLIFEDDDDRMALLLRLKNSFRQSDISVLSWCFMSNHFHLVLEDPKDAMSPSMKRALSSYVLNFNTRHQRVGHLFQDRFYSTPVLDDSHFLTAIDYVHLNPARAYGGSILGYRWSSLNAFVLGHDEFAFCDMCRVQELSSLCVDQRAYLSHLYDVLKLDSITYGMREKLSDEDALRLVRHLAAPFDACDIKALDKNQRSAIMIRARKAGVTVGQLVRCCGLGEATVKRATAGWRDASNDPFSSVPNGSSQLSA